MILSLVVVLGGAVYGLYAFRGSVRENASKAATPRHAESSSSSPGTSSILGVGITCSLDEILNEFGNTIGWSVTIEGTNLDAETQATGVKIHVPWGTAIEGQNTARGVHRFDGPTPPTVVASAETFATGTYGGSLTSCTVTIGEEPTPTPTPTPIADQPPIGAFDAVTCTSIIGWAFDPDQPQTILDVHVYRDGPAGSGGVFVGSYRADKSRLDVNQAYGVTGVHGFDIPTPAVLKDGTPHQVYVYALNPVSGAVNPQLTGSPRVVSCPGVPTACVLDVQKTVNATSAKVNDEVMYTIDVRNTGSAACTGPVKLVDVYDAGFVFTRETHSSGVERGYGTEPFHAVNTRTLTWNAGVLSPSQAVQVVFYGQIRAAVGCGGGTIPNRAQATAKEYGNLTTWVYSPTVSVIVPNTCTNGDQTDVGVQKSVSPSLISVGQTAVFTVKVKNYGPKAATAISVKDTLPSGVTMTGFVAGQGSFSESGMVWTVGSLAVGAEATLTLTVKGDTVGAKLNTASVTGVTPQDQNAGNNQATATLTVAAPEIPPVVCAPGTQTAFTGQTVAFAAVGGTGAYTWSAPDGAPTAGAGSGFTTQFTTVGAKTVTVTSGDRTATCAVQVATATTPVDLAVTKQVTPAVVRVGAAATFTITVTNRTGSAVSGVRLLDALPSGLTFVGQTASLGAYSEVTKIWEVGALAPGATATLALQVVGSQVGSYVNRVDLTNSTPTDTDSSNNSASATLIVEAAVGAPLACAVSQSQVSIGVPVTAYASGGSGVFAWTVTGGSPAQGLGLTFATSFAVAGSYVIQVSSAGATAQCNVVVTAPVQSSADLSIKKTASPVHVTTQGETIFTITLANGGPGAAQLVSVRDVLPAAVIFVAATASRGTYDAGSGIWTVGLVQPGEQVVLLITARLPRLGSYENSAEVWTSGTPDPDSTPGNENPSEDDRATATVTVAEGLAPAGFPLGPVSAFMLLCAVAAIAAIRVKTVRRVKLHTPVGRVRVGFDDKV